MSIFVVLSVATVVAIFQISSINGMKDSDIEYILGQLHKKGFSFERSPLDQSLEMADRSDDKQQLVENIARSPQVQIGFPYKDKDLFYEKDSRNKRTTYSNLPWKQILYVKPAWLKSVFTPRKQNYPLDGNNNLGDYSKVYLVLDPDADITESDVRDLSNKVASLLTKSRTTLSKSWVKDRFQNEHRYKGFVMKDNLRRTQESKEKFAERDAIERDYKPKRARVEYGRGRTPIPYIRQRGDIFERE